jgi:methylenetetrahydrofolate reductase (NADPH)
MKRLLRFAAQFGVASSASIVRKYGFSLANLVSRAGPEQFLDRLLTGIGNRDMGVILLHLYPFGGIQQTVDWAGRHVTDQT